MEVGYPLAASSPPLAPIPLEPYAVQEPQLVELSQPVDEDSWRYSRFALPWLLWVFAWLLALFCLTFWQQTGDIKNFNDGVPRLVQLSPEGTTEAGMPKTLRNLRIAEGWFGFFGIVIAFIVFFARPTQGIRKAVNVLCALLLIVCCVLAWIAFGVGLSNYKSQQQCPFNSQLTGQHCLKHIAYAIVEVALDAAVAVGSMISAILLVYNTIGNHWKLAPRDWEEAQADTLETRKERIPGEMVQRNVSYVRKWLTGIALLATLLCIIALEVWVVILHEDRQKQVIMGIRGRSDASQLYASTTPYEHPGWRVSNTRLRYSLTGIGILAILFNFLPFRSKTIAYFFAFLYLGVGTMSMVAFGFDVHDLRHAGTLGCPKSPLGTPQECPKGSFIATAIIDFFITLWLLIYLLVEYVLMQKRQCQHCDRAFEMHELVKHEAADCPARPVRCEVCAKAMNFKHFEQHRSYCSLDHVRCRNCSNMVPKWGLKAHQEECVRWPVQCTMCEDTFQRGDMPHHVMICPNRPTSCDACGETFRSRDMEAHRALCGEVLVQCNQCEDHMQRFRLQQHQHSDCPKRLLQCERCRTMVPLFRWERHQHKECSS